ncbi:MAG: C/D box methylation guide ribonucleoprotein complex aNOP56 subunit, partial [Thermoplasmata archaeon]|nr:C/D box methylation guide ribonucleoprotein complex aNOP56 subunit [Thermoplasmata archaeon]
RLARLPASTGQVLGAEKAFFEHLRGRAPPPRHGLLFLHPKLHSAPRAQRGRLARALAGKVAIAARLDRGGAAVRPELKRAFEKRAEAIGKQTVRASRRGRPELRLPLDRAAEDR